MKRLSFIALLLALAGCATTGSTASSTGESSSPSAPAQTQKLAITNVIPFDVASCAPRQLSLAPLTAEVLVGAMLSMGSATQECFVDLQARDGQPFELKAKMAVTEAGVSLDVSGLGATGFGKACVEAALKKLPLQGLPPGSKPVSGEIPIAGGPQTVKLGENAANDVAGKLRLAQPALCDCYAKLGTKPPPSLRAEIEVDATGVVKANFGSTEELAVCLAPKIQALKLGNEPTKLTWPLLLRNSYADGVDFAAPAALRFQQLDGQRAQRTADVLIAGGHRAAAALAYDELAQKYKKKPTSGLLEELKTKCAQVVAGDDRQLLSLKGLTAVLEESQALVSNEKAKEAQWLQLEPLLAHQLTSTKAEIARVEEQKKSDLNACPKAKY